MLTRRNGLVVLVALLASIFSGCATTDDGLPPPYVPSVRGPSGARSLANELGLVPRIDPAMGVLALEGDLGRIVFVTGTRTVTVAGERLEIGDTAYLDDGDILLSTRDSVTISTSWNAAMARLRARQAALSRVVVPPAAPQNGHTGSAVGDPAWDVPLKRKWEGILIHHSATDSGNLDKFDYHHRVVNGWLMVGYDFIICNGNGGADGLIEMTDRWRQQIQGAHAGPGLKQYNDHWVGICLVGDFNRGKPTPRQMASLRRLVTYLQQRCGIPDTNVRGHRDVRDTECPGDHFPLSEFQGGPRAR